MFKFKYSREQLLTIRKSLISIMPLDTIITDDFPEEVKKPHVQEPWVPFSERLITATTSKQIRDQRRVVQSLNKITQSTYDLILEELTSHLKNNKDLLLWTAHIISEKVIYEPKYAVMYVNLCCDLSKNTTVLFKKSILRGCQSEFEKNHKMIKPLSLIEICSNAIIHNKDLLMKSTTLPLDLQTMLQEKKDRLDAKLKIITKRRRAGSMVFICELFKQNVVTEKVILFIMNRLLYLSLLRISSRFEDVEILCSLLVMIGKLIDNEKNVKIMNEVSKMMEDMSAEENTPSRIKFMILDVFELRRAKWIKTGRE